MIPFLLIAGAAGLGYAAAKYSSLPPEERSALDDRVSRWALSRVGLENVILGSVDQ